MDVRYVAPGFDRPELRDAPDARFAPAPGGAVLPNGFLSTTARPTCDGALRDVVTGALRAQESMRSAAPDDRRRPYDPSADRVAAGP